MNWTEFQTYLHDVVNDKFEKPCRIFNGNRTQDGHARIKYYGKPQLAHRVAWHIVYGRWPTPQCNHHCDEGACCEITHLYEGTQKQNMQDRSKRGVYPVSDYYRCGHLKGVDDVRNGTTHSGKTGYICGICTRARRARNRL